MVQNKLLVTGDVILDRQIYIATERNTFQQDTGGGAYLIYELLRRIIAKANGVNGPGNDEVVKLGIEPFDVATMRLRPDLHCFATYRMLKRTHKSDESDTVWRSSDALGYGSPMEGVKSPLGNVDGSATDSESTWLWVLDDANRGFRNGMANASGNALPAGSIWPIWNETLKPEWVVHKISGTLATGDLWRALAVGGNVMRALQEVSVVPSLADRLIAVVSIEALRAEGAFVSRGVSWEQILSAVVRWVTRFAKDQVLFNIRKARFVIVGCGAEGAIVIDNTQNDVRVVFDNCHTESEWTEKYPGSVFGRQSVLTAAVAAALRNKTLTSQSDSELFDVICHGVQAGIAGIRKLTEVGHGSKEDALKDVKPGWPMETVSDVVANHLQNRRFPGSDDLGEFSAKLDSGFLQSQPDTWRMIDRPSTPSSGNKTQSTPQFGQARLIAQFGIRLGSLQVPYLEIGGLLSVDRREIESLRTIKHLVQNYEKLRSPKGPLCLGVFGQPGCGKSFGVKEVSRAFLSKDVPILEFNLSQFRSPDDLAAALHQVRDEVLQGRTPIVFWDEFDTSDNSWLRYLLAPMQDGKFRHGPLEHKIGKCVFVFAGGTSYDFDSFGPPDDWESAVQAGSVSAKVRAELRTRYTKERDEFVKAKGPDFKSRLNGFLDVAGPNQRKKFDWGKQRWQPDPTDIGFPIRRALLLRSLLGKKDDDQLDMDSGLLNALLLIDYHHGARSMEKLVEQMKARSNGEKLIRSHLPPREVLALHLDVDVFEKLLDLANHFLQIIEKVAPLLHENYRSGIQYYQQALKGKEKKLRSQASIAKKAGSPKEKQLLEEADRLQIERELAISPEMSRPFNELPLATQEENITQARRLPELLSIVKLIVVEKSQNTGRGSNALAEHLETLAEFEHILWMKDKMRNGWKYGTVESEIVQEDIDKHQKVRLDRGELRLEGLALQRKLFEFRKRRHLHPCLIPYAQLPEWEKDKDRNLIKNIGGILAGLGFVVVPMAD